MIVVPAQSHFHRYGKVNRVDHARYHFRSSVGVTHQSSAAARSVYLGHRATHVQVNGLIVVLFQPFRCFDQVLRDAAVNLNGKRSIFRTGFDQFHRLARL